jgi:hypothetical protein
MYITSNQIRTDDFYLEGRCYTNLTILVIYYKKILIHILYKSEVNRTPTDDFGDRHTANYTTLFIKNIN